MRKILYSFVFIFTILYVRVEAQSFQNSPFYQSNKNENLLVYPNPAKDFLYLKTSNSNIKIKSITFYSIVGKVVADIPINSNFSEVRIDKLKSGKYLMKYVLSDNTQKIVQIIKQ